MPRTVQEIEKDVTQLTSAELAAFSAWFAEYEAQRWDEQLVADVAAGRLDALAEEALNDVRRGWTSPR